VSARHASLLFLGDPKLDRRIQSFAHVLKRDGFTVTIYHSIPGRSSADSSQKDGVRYISLLSKRSVGPRMFLDHHLALRKSIAEISRSEVIVACDLYSLRAASQAKRRSLMSILLYDARELYTGLPAVASRPFVRMLWKKWESDGMKNVDFIIVTAPHDANAIFEVHRFVPRPILIRNIPLRTSQIVPADLSQFGIPPGSKVAVYVGGLQKDRGLEQSILAMKHLPADIKLLLLGGGALDQALRSLVTTEQLGDRVIFAGPVDQSSVMPVLAACDVGLSIIEGNSPSYELALPSKIFEYLRAGLPVVSTPLKHVVELFDHQPYMSYINQVEPGSIASAILSVIESKHELSNAIVDAAQQFSFEGDYEKLKLLLEERLAERG
jgi:glycosyltransferase involved in cell wall biosynthesis